MLAIKTTFEFCFYSKNNKFIYSTRNWLSLHIQQRYVENDMETRETKNKTTFFYCFLSLV